VVRGGSAGERDDKDPHNEKAPPDHSGEPFENFRIFRHTDIGVTIKGYHAFAGLSRGFQRKFEKLDPINAKPPGYPQFAD
jgi:hypothetical protein